MFIESTPTGMQLYTSLDQKVLPLCTWQQQWMTFAAFKAMEKSEVKKEKKKKTVMGKSEVKKKKTL